MKTQDNYKVLSHAGKLIAMGTLGQMFSYVKYHVPDGRYRIVGPDLKLHCLRNGGFIQSDPDAVSLQSSTRPTGIAGLLHGAATQDEEHGDEQ